MKFAAFLRAVNLPGRSVAMAGLRSCFETLGYDGVRTLLQSGNVVFEAAKRPNSALETEIEKALAQSLGLQTPVIVRSARQLEEIVAHNPFPREAHRDPAHLLVVFLKGKPDRAHAQSLQAAIAGPERVVLLGDVLFATYPDGMGRSKLTAALIDKKLETSVTARNWNTLLKLIALMG